MRTTLRTEIVIAIRTHYWNSTVGMLARRIRGSCPNIRIVVLADESNGLINCDDFEKIGHTSDFSGFDLPAIPLNQSLWFNGDYPLYLIRKMLPDYSYYIMIENDVAVNADLTKIVNSIIDNDISFVACELSARDSRWDFYDSAKDHFNEIYGCLLPFISVSGGLIDYLYEKRLQIWKKKSQYDGVSWPFCEAFIASSAIQFSPDRCADLRSFFELPYFVFKPAIHVGHPWANLPDWISHPVLSGRHFVKKRLSEESLEDLFDPNSKLYDDFRYCHKDELYYPLYEIILESRSSALMDKYLAYLAGRGFNDHPFGQSLAE